MIGKGRGRIGGGFGRRGHRVSNRCVRKALFRSPTDVIGLEGHHPEGDRNVLTDLRIGRDARDDRHRPNVQRNRVGVYLFGHRTFVGRGDAAIDLRNAAIHQVLVRLIGRTHGSYCRLAVKIPLIRGRPTRINIFEDTQVKVVAVANRRVAAEFRLSQHPFVDGNVDGLLNRIHTVKYFGRIDGMTDRRHELDTVNRIGQSGQNARRVFGRSAERIVILAGTTVRIHHQFDGIVFADHKPLIRIRRQLTAQYTDSNAIAVRTAVSVFGYINIIVNRLGQTRGALHIRANGDSRLYSIRSAGNQVFFRLPINVHRTIVLAFDIGKQDGVGVDTNRKVVAQVNRR